MSGRIIDDPIEQGCIHPDHNNFPGHIVIPPGKAYEHTCNGCGKVTVLRGTQVRW